jgi:hypothetical protein
MIYAHSTFQVPSSNASLVIVQEDLYTSNSRSSLQFSFLTMQIMNSSNGHKRQISGHTVAKLVVGGSATRQQAVR